MKTVLAYGDSLTWGHDPADGSRHPRAVRWPVVLAEGLGDTEVITDGLGGRNTVFEDHAGPADRCAARTLPVALTAHMPLDLVILMLGTNDLKPAICGLAEGAEKGMQRLIRLVQCHPFDHAGCATPKLLIVAPPPQVASGDRHSAHRIDQSQRLAGLYEGLSQRLGTAFFDAATVCRASEMDGTHLDAANTMALGRALVPVVRALLT